MTSELASYESRNCILPHLVDVHANRGHIPQWLPIIRKINMEVCKCL